MLHSKSRWPSPLWSLAVLMVGFMATAAFAQDAAAPVEAAQAVADAAATAAEAAPAKPWDGDYDTGSIAWMLTSSALVLLMVPGLALFYGGMVRAKNALNMLMCCFAAIGVAGLVWAAVGYAIAFPVVGPGTSIISTGGTGDAGSPLVSWLAFDPSLVFLRSFSSADPTSPNFIGRMLVSGDTENAVPNGIPELVFVMFQGKFFIITPALIVGALAERVRFGPFLLFMILWSIIVYSPVAHWVWNVNGWLFQRGVMDFAGGTVVHVLAGVSALAVCLVVGPRKNYGTLPMPPHSLGLTLVGAGLLWFGWFGFNAGSAVALPGAELPIAGWVAGLAFANTQIAAAAAATAWMIIEWLVTKKPTILGFASGMVAGLVVITPCAGHVLPWHSIIIGAMGGLVCFYGCRLKNLFKYDDSLDAFGVHGVGGALGALLVGIFAIRPLTAAGETPGGFGQFTNQLIGLVVCSVFAFVVSYVLAFAIKATIGLRVEDDVEDDGLDIRVHGETAYHLMG